MKKYVIGALFISLLTVSGCSMLPTGQVAEGVYFNNKDMSGLSKEEAKQVIDRAIDEENLEITLVNHKGEQVSVPAKKIGIKVNTDKVLDEIFAVGYESDIKSAIYSRFKALTNHIEIPIEYELDGPVAQTYLQEYGKSIDEVGQDASITLENGQIVRHPAKVGTALDVKKTYDKLLTMVENQEFGPLEAVIDTHKQPKVSDADIAGITTVLATYTTQYDASSTNRSHNIELATQKINGTLVHSGEQFSFNAIVGERTAEAGYDDAPVMVDGKLVPGIGGGICQVSSTLFNATYLSGMSIVERTSHYAAVGYVPQGRDATVAYGYLDYIFSNPFSTPVYILATANDGNLTVYVLGAEAGRLKNVDIQVSSPVPNPNVPGGTKVTTTRTITYSDGHIEKDSLDSEYESIKP